MVSVMLSDLVGGCKAVIIEMLPKDVKHKFKIGEIDVLIASVDSFKEDLEDFVVAVDNGKGDD